MNFGGEWAQTRQTRKKGGKKKKEKRKHSRRERQLYKRELMRPVTRRLSPDTNRASLEHRYATAPAQSEGTPTGPMPKSSLDSSVAVEPSHSILLRAVWMVGGGGGSAHTRHHHHHNSRSVYMGRRGHRAYTRAHVGRVCQVQRALMTPGARQFTRMPRGNSSFAATFVSASKAVLPAGWGHQRKAERGRGTMGSKKVHSNDTQSQCAHTHAHTRRAAHTRTHESLRACPATCVHLQMVYPPIMGLGSYAPI
jgi:hypothetical protein